jgi:hypothetical protein
MTVAKLSTGPKLDAKEKDVHIIKLAPDTVIARMMANHAPKEQILGEASKHVASAKKTDIVVFDHQPWHVVKGLMRPHPQVHIDDPETILKISFKQQERPCWWSEHAFTITRIEPSSHHGPAAPGPPAAPPPVAASGAPDYPFATGQVPMTGQQELAHDGQPIFVVRCAPIVAGAIGHTYKITFNIGEDIDPDMEGTP